MQTAAGRVARSMHLLVCGEREEKGGKGNKLSMPFMRKACVEDGLNTWYNKGQSSKAKAASSGGISRKEAPNLRTRPPGLARIPAAALESFRACSRRPSPSLPLSLSLSHSASLEQKRITFSGKGRENDGDAAAAISVLLLFPLREKEIYDTRKLLGETALSLSLSAICRCGEGESESDRMESPMGVARGGRGFG